MRVRVVLGVCAVWILLGIVLGSQSALGMMMENTPVVLVDSIRTSVVNFLPWIPATWVAVAVALRFPVTTTTWRRVLPVHFVAVLAVSWVFKGTWSAHWARASPESIARSSSISTG